MRARGGDQYSENLSTNNKSRTSPPWEVLFPSLYHSNAQSSVICGNSLPEKSAPTIRPTAIPTAHRRRMTTTTIHPPATMAAVIPLIAATAVLVAAIFGFFSIKISFWHFSAPDWFNSCFSLCTYSVPTFIAFGNFFFVFLLLGSTQLIKEIWN